MGEKFYITRANFGLKIKKLKLLLRRGVPALIATAT